MKYKTCKMILSGFFAGMLIALGGWCFVMSKSYPIVGQLIGASMFPLGLYIICTLKANLYTGKIGYLITYGESAKDKLKYAYDLFLMFVGNLIGAGFIGIIAANVDSSFTDKAMMICQTKTINFSGNVWDQIFICFVKAFVCGFLVYLAVHLFKNATSSAEKIIGVWLPIFVFVFVGCLHCVADIFYLTAGMCWSWASVLYIAIVIFGNSIGAFFLNALTETLK